MKKEQKNKNPSRGVPKVKKPNPIIVTLGETTAFDSLNSQIAVAEQRLQASREAMAAFLKLLEIKYDATFDPESTNLVPNKVSAEESPVE